MHAAPYTPINGLEWGLLLQHYDDASVTNVRHGALTVANDTFQISFLQLGSEPAFAVNLAQIIDISKKILATCGNTGKCAPMKKGIIAGLQHIELNVREIVDRDKLRGTQAYYDATEYYDETLNLTEAAEATPESRARKEIADLASSSTVTDVTLCRVREKIAENHNLLFALTSYQESFFDMVGSRCSPDLLLPLIRDILKNVGQIDRAHLSRLKSFLFQVHAPQPSFFELLVKQEDGNQLFDFLISTITDTEINDDGFKKVQVLKYAYSVRRYEYIFMNVEQLPVIDKLNAAKCYQQAKLTLGQRSIFEKYGDKPGFSRWLRLRQASSTTLSQGGAKEASSARWIRADQKRSQYAREDRGTTRPFTEEKMKKLHRLLAEGEEGIKHPGELRTGIVRTSGGATHMYCPAEFLPENFASFVEWFNLGLLFCENGDLNPVIFSGQSYERAVSVHPFEGANGRWSREIMDYVLERFELPPSILGEDILDALFPLDAKKSNHEAFVRKIVIGIQLSKTELARLET